MKNMIKDEIVEPMVAIKAKEPYSKNARALQSLAIKPSIQKIAAITAKRMGKAYIKCRLIFIKIDVIKKLIKPVNIIAIPNVMICSNDGICWYLSIFLHITTK